MNVRREESLHPTSRLNSTHKSEHFLMHVEEAEVDEELKGKPLQYIMAGATAGLVEHACTFYSHSDQF